MYRWETAGYLNLANALAGEIVDNPNALTAADAHAAEALKSFHDWEYLKAVREARAAYDILVQAKESLRPFRRRAVGR
jgi:hypothetical protein